MLTFMRTFLPQTVVPQKKCSICKSTLFSLPKSHLCGDPSIWNPCTKSEVYSPMEALDFFCTHKEQFSVACLFFVDSKCAIGQMWFIWILLGFNRKVPGRSIVQTSIKYLQVFPATLKRVVWPLQFSFKFCSDLWSKLLQFGFKFWIHWW